MFPHLRRFEYEENIFYSSCPIDIGTVIEYGIFLTLLNQLMKALSLTQIIFYPSQPLSSCSRLLATHNHVQFITIF